MLRNSALAICRNMTSFLVTWKSVHMKVLGIDLMIIYDLSSHDPQTSGSNKPQINQFYPASKFKTQKEHREIILR